MCSGDPYKGIAALADEAVDRLAERLELRAAADDQREMCQRYLDDLALPAGARVLEVGCGTGAVARLIAQRPEVEEVCGLDASPRLLEHARRRADGLPKLAFDAGDARRLPYDDAAFEAVVFHTTLCHVPQAALALEEAHRVLRVSGRLAVFDGDCPTATVESGPHDPLQAAVEAWIDGLHHDPWLIRRLPRLLDESGFEIVRARSYGYLELGEADYLLTLVDRGAALLHERGSISADGVEAMRAEARHRVAAGTFYGHIAYASFVATRR